MPDKWNAVLLRLGGDREVGFARDVVIYLDEIPSLRLKVIHCRACLSCIFNNDGVVGMDRRRTVHNRATCNQLRAEALPFLEFLPPASELIGVAAHIAHA